VFSNHYIHAQYTYRNIYIKQLYIYYHCYSLDIAGATARGMRATSAMTRVASMAEMHVEAIASSWNLRTQDAKPAGRKGEAWQHTHVTHPIADTCHTYALLQPRHSHMNP
jgi:hypothetical protein